VLEQANTGGVRGAMLVNSEGSILSSAGDESSQNKAVSAIASNIWNSFQQHHSQDEELEFLVLECEEGAFVATRISTVLLVLHGDSSVGLGMLKLKAAKLKEYLKVPLEQVTI